jgi:hypothetical protein
MREIATQAHNYLLSGMFGITTEFRVLSRLNFCREAILPAYSMVGFYPKFNPEFNGEDHPHPYRLIERALHGKPISRDVRVNLSGSPTKFVLRRFGIHRRY